MADKQPMQADGEGGKAEQPDGVNNAHPDGNQGGPYPNGVEGDHKNSGFFGHGGQTEIEYSGSKDGGEDNAATE